MLLLVEVSDTTLHYDKNVKLPLYARYGIPEVWIVDLTDNVIEVYSGPVASGYEKVARFVPGEKLSSPSVPDLSVRVSEVVGS